MIPETDDKWSVSWQSPSVAVFSMDSEGVTSVTIPPPSIIEPEEGWRVEFPHTHYGGDRPDWSVAFGYGTLDGEYESPRPYVVVEYDGLYGTHWHSLSMEQVAGLMAVLGVAVQHMAEDSVKV